jgi:hypothetical protein
MLMMSYDGQSSVATADSETAYSIPCFLDKNLLFL